MGSLTAARKTTTMMAAVATLFVVQELCLEVAVGREDTLMVKSSEELGLLID